MDAVRGAGRHAAHGGGDRLRSRRRRPPPTDAHHLVRGRAAVGPLARGPRGRATRAESDRRGAPRPVHRHGSISGHHHARHRVESRDSRPGARVRLVRIERHAPVSFGARRVDAAADARHVAIGAARRHARSTFQERRSGGDRIAHDGRGASGVDSVARHAAARDRATARGGTSKRARPVSAIRRGARCRPDAVESGPLVSGQTTALGHRARLRRARAADASVHRAIRHADVDDRATTLGRSDAVLADAHRTNDPTRTENSRHAPHDTTVGASDCVRRQRAGRRGIRVCMLAAIRHDGPQAGAPAGHRQSDIPRVPGREAGAAPAEQSGSGISRSATAHEHGRNRVDAIRRRHERPTDDRDVPSTRKHRHRLYGSRTRGDPGVALLAGGCRWKEGQAARANAVQLQRGEGRRRRVQRLGEVQSDAAAAARIVEWPRRETHDGPEWRLPRVSGREGGHAAAGQRWAAVSH